MGVRGIRRRSALAAAGLLAGLAVTSVGTAPGSASSSTAAVPAAKAFASTGVEQSYTVPPNLMLVETDLNGANGGGGDVGMPLGGYLRVTAGEKLYVEVGVNGDFAGGATFGGGGAAGAGSLALGSGPCAGLTGSCGGALSASGGGASDIRACSEHVTKCAGGGNSELSRIEVAGGGGGAGGGGETAGWYCTELPQKGYGYNRQPLPHGNPAQGPVPIRTKAGIVIPGEPADYSYGPIKDVTASQGGSTKPGAGGALGTCEVDEVNNGSVLENTWAGSIRGASGSGANGGAGASVTGHFGFETPGGWIPGAGGGGGGGYTGGGGGSTGDICTYSVKSPPCNNPSGGMGGGGGSSFAARQVFQPFVQDGAGFGAVDHRDPDRRDRHPESRRRVPRRTSRRCAVGVRQLSGHLVQEHDRLGQPDRHHPRDAHIHGHDERVPDERRRNLDHHLPRLRQGALVPPRPRASDLPRDPAVTSVTEVLWSDGHSCFPAGIR